MLCQTKREEGSPCVRQELFLEMREGLRTEENVNCLYKYL